MGGRTVDDKEMEHIRNGKEGVKTYREKDLVKYDQRYKYDLSNLHCVRSREKVSLDKDNLDYSRTNSLSPT